MKNNYPFKDLIIFENDNFMINQDWEIPIQGFFILSTKRKIRSFMEFTEQEAKEFMFLLIKTRKLMKEKLAIKDVYFFQREDSEHGFHLWIFPRLEWMKDFGEKIESIRPIMEFARKNMFTEYNIENVKIYVEIMREAFKK